MHPCKYCPCSEGCGIDTVVFREQFACSCKVIQSLGITLCYGIPWKLDSICYIFGRSEHKRYCRLIVGSTGFIRQPEKPDELKVSPTSEKACFSLNQVLVFLFKNCKCLRI